MIDSEIVLGSNIITLNDLTTDKKNFYKVYSFGIQCPTREINEPKVEDHGIDDYDAYLDAGAAELNGKIKAESRSKMYELKEALKAAFSPSLYDYEDLKYTEPGRSAKQISVRSIGVMFVPEEKGQGKNLKFTIKLKIKDPFAYSQTLHSEDFTFDAGDQIGYPFYYPVYYGAGGATASLSCSNAGNPVAYPTIVINGPITGPYVENVTTGDKLEFQSDLELAAGETLTISMKEKTAIKASSGTNTNVYQYKVASSDFWGLQAGSNSVTLGGITTDTSGGGTISWRDTYSL